MYYCIYMSLVRVSTEDYTTKVWILKKQPRNASTTLIRNAYTTGETLLRNVPSLAKLLRNACDTQLRNIPIRDTTSTKCSHLSWHFYEMLPSLVTQLRNVTVDTLLRFTILRHSRKDGNIPIPRVSIFIPNLSIIIHQSFLFRLFTKQLLHMYLSHI